MINSSVCKWYQDKQHCYNLLDTRYCRCQMTRLNDKKKGNFKCTHQNLQLITSNRDNLQFTPTYFISSFLLTPPVLWKPNKALKLFFTLFYQNQSQDLKIIFNIQPGRFFWWPSTAAPICDLFFSIASPLFYFTPLLANQKNFSILHRDFYMDNQFMPQKGNLNESTLRIKIKEYLV